MRLRRTAVPKPAVPRPDDGAATSRAINAFALLAAGLLALAPPAAWWVAGHGRVAAETEMSALVRADLVSEAIARDPGGWALEPEGLAGLLSRGESRPGASRRILAANGVVVAETTGQVPWPAQVARRPLLDSGVEVGTFEVGRSLMPLLRQTGVVALVSLLLAIGALVALRRGPRRMLARVAAQAAHAASHDALTGLPNRALLQDRLRQAAAGCRRRNNGTIAVLVLDLDHFKEVNDALGHVAGDRLLSEVALRLLSSLRESDTLARLGGDEFAIVQTDIAQPHGATALASRLIEVMKRPFDLNGQEASVGVSIGIALAEKPAAADPVRLMQEADLALYDVKADGRNGFRFFASHMNAALLARRVLEADLRAAMAEGMLRLHFQPQVDLLSRQVTGAEALLRWQHPVRGNVPPDAFIPLAERTGLIVPIGAWVLEEACRHAMTWERPLRVAVNVSAVQFRHAGFLGTVEHALTVTGLPPGRLELEVTESLLLADTEETLETLGRLHAMGIAVAMDDFGTGYSSLGYLQRFRFDKVKIDRSFIRDLGDDPRAAAIVRAIVGMTDALGIRANAEGVETEAQADRLRAEGCEEVQGYFFGRPVEAGVFAELAREGVPAAA